MGLGSILTTLVLASNVIGAPVASGSSPDEVVEGQPHARQPRRSDPVRPIEWGDLNFIHTTDTHGWLAGHILERQFSGDWGDFVSFGERIRAIADEKGVDVIMVDTGDRHDGNGLSDASRQDGSLSLPIFCEAEYDVVTIGNHELYRGAASLQEYHKIRKHFKDRYVVSNVEVAVGRTWVPLGNKYRIFTTKNQKRQVLALGFLFNFDGNDRDVTRVTTVEEELAKPWFQQLLREVVPTIDHIVVSGHIPPRGSPEFDQILEKIRSVSRTVPVSMFGGHSHIRDYRVFDDYAVALQAGRYVETIGWASVNLTGPAPVFSRSYIDFNARTMAIHAGVDGPGELATPRGRSISADIAKARSFLNLDEFKATVPQNYYTDRAPYPSEASIFTLLEKKVLPLLSSPPELNGTTRYVLLNTGSIRFDLFKGPYTKDSGYILSPFKNEWFYIAGVPRSIADKVLPIINQAERVLSSRSRYTPQQVRSSDGAHSDSSILRDLNDNGFDQGVTPFKRPSRGYVTHDDLDDKGDDTVHDPWVFHPIPNAIQTILEASSGTKENTEEEKVSLIFQDFLARFVRAALVQLDREDLFDPVFHGGEVVIELVPRYLKSLEEQQL